VYVPRFIYGKQTDFQSSVIAVDVHNFSQMIQLKGLQVAAAEFLQKSTVPSDVFLVLNMWVLLEKTDKYDDCFHVRKL
jgi:hypothetical protein